MTIQSLIPFTFYTWCLSIDHNHPIWWYCYIFSNKVKDGIFHSNLPYFCFWFLPFAKLWLDQNLNKLQMQFDLPSLHMIALIRFEFGFERNVVVCEGTFGFNDNGVGSAGKTGKWRDAICERIYTVERNRKSNFEEKHLKRDRQLGQNSASRQKKANLFYIRPMI